MHRISLPAVLSFSPRPRHRPEYRLVSRLRAAADADVWVVEVVVHRHNAQSTRSPHPLLLSLPAPSLSPAPSPSPSPSPSSSEYDFGYAWLQDAASPRMPTAGRRGGAYAAHTCVYLGRPPSRPPPTLTPRSPFPPLPPPPLTLAVLVIGFGRGVRLGFGDRSRMWKGCAELQQVQDAACSAGRPGGGVRGAKCTRRPCTFLLPPPSPPPPLPPPSRSPSPAAIVAADGKGARMRTYGRTHTPASMGEGESVRWRRCGCGTYPSLALPSSFTRTYTRAVDIGPGRVCGMRTLPSSSVSLSRSSSSVGCGTHGIRRGPRALPLSSGSPSCSYLVAIAHGERGIGMRRSMTQASMHRGRLMMLCSAVLYPSFALHRTASALEDVPTLHSTYIHTHFAWIAGIKSTLPISSCAVKLMRAFDCAAHRFQQILSLPLSCGRKKANGPNDTNLAELDLFSDHSGLTPKGGLS
ncbi:hypothetical protein B0H13DRAFT_756327 [Mycena leptocephala]|nr:hypothetical protein B0H13DRAFT_756327 [Mycena leptocephala]